MSARRDALAGAKAIAPLLLGVAPFGLVVGVTAVNVGLSPVEAVGMSIVVFAGASQLAAIELIGRSAPVAVVVLTAVVINLRHVMYSASIAPYLRRFDATARWLGAYTLTDQVYAVAISEFRESTPEDRSRVPFYFGAAVTLWLPWQVATAVGAVAGAAVPPGLSLEFAVPLTFVALLVPTLEDRGTWTAAAVAGAVGVVGTVLPFDLGLVTAAVAGIAAGTLVEVRAGEFPTLGEAGETGAAGEEGSTDVGADEHGPAGNGPGECWSETGSAGDDGRGGPR